MNPAHRGPAAYGALSLKCCGGAGSDGYILGTGAATKIPFPYRRWPYQISKVGSLPQKQRQGEERQAMPASWPLLTPPSPTPPHALLPTPTPTAHTFLLLGSRMAGWASASWLPKCVKYRNHTRGTGRLFNIPTLPRSLP